MQIKGTQKYNKMNTKYSKLKVITLLLLMVLIFAVAIFFVAILDRKFSEDGIEKTFETFWKRIQSQNAYANANETELVPEVTRIQRAASDLRRNQTANNYYEEQSAVVVNAETSQNVPYQAEADPVVDSYERDPYYGGSDYFGDAEYPQDPTSDLNSERSMTSGEDFPSSESGARARYDQAYTQWRYTTQAPSVKADEFGVKYSREPYMGYNYDYHLASKDSKPQHPDYHMDEYYKANKKTALETTQVKQEPTLLVILRSLKQIWDIYQALASAWSSIQQHHQKAAIQKPHKEEPVNEHQQKKTRINSKKPPRIDSSNNGQSIQSKNSKTTVIPAISSSQNDEVMPNRTETVLAAKVDKSKKKSVRERRDADSNSSTAVEEGRYIKGDPLKGYYDFIITEGSYKFWAVFQVGTAILIIYSTFAAIYYSKVNPLVGDYDYTDYLGGARSNSGDDLDFVDDASDPLKSSWSNWVPRTKHSLQFILDAIDKIPLVEEKNEFKTDTQEGTLSKM